MGDGAKVIDTMTIGNLFWSSFSQKREKDPNWLIVYDYFKGVETQSYEECLKLGAGLKHSLYKQLPRFRINEEISTIIDTKLTWNDIRLEAGKVVKHILERTRKDFAPTISYDLEPAIRFLVVELDTGKLRPREWIPYVQDFKRIKKLSLIHGGERGGRLTEFIRQIECLRKLGGLRSLRV